MQSPSDPLEKRPAALGLWDAVSVIVGIVVGVSIFEVPPKVFGNVGDSWQGIAVWAVGGLVALVGALCYGELASTYPGSGGDYVYVTQAYGPMVGFLFAWIRIAIIITANIAAMAYVFADYGVSVFRCEPSRGFWFAGGAIIALTLINALGLRVGKSMQNLLTVLKVLGLGGLIVIGLWKGNVSSWQASERVSGR